MRDLRGGGISDILKISNLSIMIQEFTDISNVQEEYSKTWEEESKHPQHSYRKKIRKRASLSAYTIRGLKGKDDSF